MKSEIRDTKAANRGQAERRGSTKRSSFSRTIGISTSEVWIGIVLLVFAGLASNRAAPNSLFIPRCNVILLLGLPGDIESENMFHDQLQNWLNMITTWNGVQKLFVLCDSPETVTLPTNTISKVMKSDRNNFVALGQSLGDATNPLVVITWGHGGTQGSTPVFHVRGPRLTPPDFAALAAKLPAAESRWLLLFRGSGRFAASLAGPHRQVLASECDTAFSSDPVEMSLLLKLIRARTELSFGALAEELGSATAAWYGERHLARTEEPTLWADGEKPRMLAERPVADYTASEGRILNKIALAAELKPNQTNAPRLKPLTPESVSNELPAGWRALKKVEPKEYPDADGVILRQEISCTLGHNPALVTEHEQYLQILKPEGKQFGDFDVSFSPPNEEVEFLDCEVLCPDGRLTRLEPDAVNEAREEPLGDYQTDRRKFFSLPGVVPGAVLHVRYRTEWKSFPLPQVSMELPLSQEVPALDSVFRINLPKEVPFHFAFEQLSAPDPTINQTRYGSTYAWHFDHLPATQREILVAPHQKPRLLFSTFANWVAFGEWYGRISKLADAVTPEISAKARDLTRDTKDDRGKVLALYNYVTALRYVAIPLGVNSIRPHAAANVLKNQFGDCKDKANLFNALLHSLNIEAQLVLVPRFSQAHDDIPGLAFNHAISRVPLDGETLWIDTTEDICRFGLLPPGDPGRKVLVINGEAAALTQLPTPKPNDHQLKIHGLLDCSRPERALPVQLSAAAVGYPDYAMRQAVRETSEHCDSLPLLAAWFRPTSGSFALDKQNATPVSALEADFSWQAEGTLVGVCSAVGNNWTLHSSFWLPNEWDQALHRRQAPLFLNQGYPLTLEEEFELSLPAGSKNAALPNLSQNTEEPLRWRIEWARINDDTLSIKLHVELARGELSAADTSVVQQQLRALLTAAGAPATFSASP